MATTRKTSKTTTARKKKAPTGKSATARKKSTSAKSSGAKKASSGRKYSRAASDKVGEVMHEMKEGELRSGRSGKRVTNPKQAVAIGLSEARKEGDEAPAPARRSRKKSG